MDKTIPESKSDSFVGGVSKMLELTGIDKSTTLGTVEEGVLELESLLRL
jgi:hypothetical protein